MEFLTVIFYHAIIVKYKKLFFQNVIGFILFYSALLSYIFIQYLPENNLMYKIYEITLEKNI